MNRKRLRKLQARFAVVNGRFDRGSDSSPEIFARELPARLAAQNGKRPISGAASPSVLGPKLEAAFAARGGNFAVSGDMPPEVFGAMLEELLACPDCRAAVLDACADQESDVTIDETLRALAMRRDH